MLEVIRVAVWVSAVSNLTYKIHVNQNLMWSSQTFAHTTFFVCIVKEMKSL